MSDVLCVQFPKVSHILLVDQALLELTDLRLYLLTKLPLHLLHHLELR